MNTTGSNIEGLIWNAAVQHRPGLIVRACSPRDVQDAIAVARDRGMPLSVLGGGHDWAGRAVCDGGLVIDLSGMRTVTVDAAARVVTVGGGATAADVMAAAAPYGLVAAAGNVGCVGMTGLTLGGGYGPLNGRFGLASDNLLGAEVVLADGRIVTADATHEPELFWALRGGGGNFGVVTALEFDLYAVPEIYAGALLYPFERGGEVLQAWRELTADVPEEISSVFKLLQLPDLPEIPDPLRGNSFAVVMAVVLGDEAAGGAFLEPLRALGPQMDTFATVPPAALSYLAMDPEDPLPYTSSGHLMSELPAEAADRVIELGGAGSGSPLAMIEFRHLGGALARSAPHHGANAALNGEYVLFALGGILAPEDAPVMDEAVRRISGALEPWRSGWYLNFVEQDFDASRAFDAETWRRLQETKARVDPDGVFVANHAITPA
jgi:FAD/FMN-containing dehydrogenase